MKKKFKFEESAKRFDKLVYTLNLEKFQNCIVEIEKSSKAQAEWMTKVDPTLWSTTYFPTIRWGFETSQFAKVMNKALHPLRGLCALHVVKELWYYLIAQQLD